MAIKIWVDQIQDKPLTMQVEEPTDSFPVLAEMQAEKVCSFTGPLRGTITAMREYDHLRVEGNVSIPVELICSRCLVSYEAVIEPAFSIFFRKGASSPEAAEEDEVELEEQDLISTTYNGDEIDLTHEIEEQVAMEIPYKPLCSEVCKGLCPTCGTDLNKGTCSCGRDEFNLKFSALKDFKVSR